MKIRTDFVTNSSSSSFVVEIQIVKKDGEMFYYSETGNENGAVGDIYIDVSPKQLGTCESVDDMIQFLKKGVHDMDYSDVDGEPAKFLFDGDDLRVKAILEGDEPEVEHRWSMLGEKTEKEAHKDAQKFIKSLETIESMSEIKYILISGQETNNDEMYNRKYLYDIETMEYSSLVDGDFIEKDGGPGGDLCFKDGWEAERVSWNTPKEKSVEAYFNPLFGSSCKCFDIKYKNSVITNILNKYNYKLDTNNCSVCSVWDYESVTPAEQDCFGINNDIIPNYSGVKTVEQLTDTLISALIEYGTSDSGLEEELNNSKEDICSAYTLIEGSSLECEREEMDALGFGGVDVICMGHDFELRDGKYTAVYREHVGGW